MPLRRGVAFVALTLSLGGLLVACFDLLHTTSDIVTACEIDAARSGCQAAATDGAADAGVEAGAGDDAETDFCAWTPDEARQHALHACSWLGACETPLGNNAFGPCYFRALMAYDCSANPNHRVHHAAHTIWDCLQQVRSCGDVDACIFGNAGPAMCGTAGLYTTCGNAPDQSVRVHCADGGGVPPFPRAGGESCALWGQTCVRGALGSTCAADDSTTGCTQMCVDGTSIHWCVAGVDGGAGNDPGIDCAGNGATACGGFPLAAPRWLACKPEGDAAPCTPAATATCQDGRATMCPTGVVETLDCARLLGSPSACSSGDLSPPFDWTSPCSLGACTEDSCDVDAATLASCERGANFSVTCASEGLGPCRMTTADPAHGPRAACTPP
jgi:hypothetical protein